MCCPAELKRFPMRRIRGRHADFAALVRECLLSAGKTHPVKPVAGAPTTCQEELRYGRGVGRARANTALKVGQRIFCFAEK